MTNQTFMRLPGPVWAIIPARGGSKSIPLKNMLSLCGRPLLDYGVLATKAASICERIIGSTESEQIAARFAALGVEHDLRPTHLCEDDSPVQAAVQDIIERLSTPQSRPWLIVLVQPTSPFLLPEHIRNLIELVASRPEARSGMTVAPCPHNHHELNQRTLDDGLVRFVHLKEREEAYNKQRKPPRWVFGNLVVTRVDAVLTGESLFAEPTVGLPIRSPYDFDLDGPHDIPVAHALLQSGAVQLSHL